MKWDYFENDKDKEPYKSSNEWYKSIKHLIKPSIIIIIFLILILIALHYLK